MSKHEVGEKFVVTIDKVFEQDGETLYRAKGMKSLVFDENGLKKLVPYKEKMEMAANAGREEVWELVNFLNMARFEDLEMIFDVPLGTADVVDYIFSLNVRDVIGKYRAWQKYKQEEINIGTVVEHKDGGRGVVILKTETWVSGLTSEGCVFSWHRNSLTKTDKKIDIVSILNEIAEV